MLLASTQIKVDEIDPITHSDNDPYPNQKAEMIMCQIQGLFSVVGLVLVPGYYEIVPSKILPCSHAILKFPGTIRFLSCCHHYHLKCMTQLYPLS